MRGLKSYLRENWGAPFVIGFMLLLLICAGLLVGSRLDLANEVAIYAYYMLVVGVVLQLVSFLRYNKKGVSESRSGDYANMVELNLSGNKTVPSIRLSDDGNKVEA